MGTLRSSSGIPPYLTEAICMEQKPTNAAGLTISNFGVVPHYSVCDDEACPFGDLDCPGFGTHPDLNLAPPGEQCDVQSGTRASEPPPLPLLLLSRDLHSTSRDLHSADSRDVPDSEIQMVLPGFDPPARRSDRKRHRRISSQDRPAVPDDEHMPTYLRRLSAHGAAVKGVGAYQYQLRATLRAAAKLHRSSVTLADLFRDASLLGRALVDDRSADGPRLSKWTLAQRRSAIRSFATLMRPELLVLLGEEPASVVDRALRLVAERIGGGYRLTGGAPRRRGGRAPSRDEVTAVLRCLGDAPDFTGLRNRAFFSILATSGCRVNALRQLDGTNCLILPNGRLRLYLHEKGKSERREVELSYDVAHDLLEYIAAFNQLAARRLWKNRVHAGKPGAIWRNSAGDRWGYSSVLKALKNGCTSAGVSEFAPHAFRRAFASDAASLLPRHVVAQAGGWKGLDRLDDHYVQPRETTICEKLTRLSQDTSLAPTETETKNASVIAI